MDLVNDLYRITVDEYERLVASGVLDDPQVELLNGFLVRKMGKRPRHATRLERLRRLLEARLPVPAGWHIRQEQPVKISEYDEPEPDLTIVSGEVEEYEDRHPDPRDVALIVEIADSSLARDQGRRLLAYARGGIPNYWIVNLVDRQVEVYSDPGPVGYRASEALKPGQELTVLLRGIDVGRIPVADVLG
jgi:Uma2 family endonuclease